jgi:hypothetical protein
VAPPIDQQPVAQPLVGPRDERLVRRLERGDALSEVGERRRGVAVVGHRGMEGGFVCMGRRATR